LRPGDIIQAVGTREVTSAEDAVAAIRDASRANGVVALRILRNGETAFVPIETPHG
jgi:S1-C subfamily serine protease